MRLKSISLIVTILLHLPVLAQAQSLSNAADLERITELETQLGATEQMVLDMSTELTNLRDQAETGLMDAARAQNQAVIDHLTYKNSLRRHAQLILWWQLISSYVLLALVCVVTILGVVLSYREVINAMKAPEKAIETFAQQGLLEDDASTGEGDVPVPGSKGATLIISAQKLQVTSAITGVVILVLSLAFLYLFVMQVLEVVPRDFSTELAPTSPDDTGGDGGNS